MSIAAARILAGRVRLVSTGLHAMLTLTSWRIEYTKSPVSFCERECIPVGWLAGFVSHAQHSAVLSEKLIAIGEFANKEKVSIVFVV